MNWQPTEIPSQQGRVALITGANSGIGLETARALAARGAHLILGCRNAEKAEAAVREIRLSAPHAVLEILPLDLSRQTSVKNAAAQVRAQHQKLDLLINNAGVMWLDRQLTEDGFEMHMATNHFGHFALTGLLIDLLQEVEGSRVVTVSSLAHRRGRINFADPTLEANYNKVRSYAQSKVANLIFAKELQRRLTAAGAKTRSLACHPGLSNTNLPSAGLIRHAPLKIGPAIKWLMPYTTQSSAQGAQPTLYAATADDVEPGGYYGPSRLLEVMGPPSQARASRYAQDPTVGRRLWELSVGLTGVNYAAITPPLTNQVVLSAQLEE